MIKCDDYGLYRRLSKVIEAEKLLARYRFLSIKSGYREILESSYRDVRNYVSVKFQKPEGPEAIEK
jgi:hypothetical protein